MRPDKLNQNDQAPKLYRELGRQLRLPEQRVSAIEQQIRRKAAEKQDQTAYIQMHRKPHRTENRLAYRLAPLVASVMVILSGALIYRTGLMKPADYDTAESDVEIVEQTGEITQTGLTTAADSAAETNAATVTVYQSGSTGTESGTEPPPVSAEITEPEQTAASAAAAPEPETTVSSAAATTAETTAETAPPVTTEAEQDIPPVETALVTLPPPAIDLQETPESAQLAMDNVLVHPGDDVSVCLYFNQPVEVNGMQFGLQLFSPSGAALPVVNAASNPILKVRPRISTLVVNNDTEMRTFYITGAQDNDVVFPAGTELIRLDLHIPEDTPVGTKFEILELLSKFVCESAENGIKLETYYGNIYVE